jgi:serine/threonine protein kinase
LDVKGALSEAEAYIIFVKIFWALVIFRGEDLDQLVHRDLKPANIGISIKTLSKEVRFQEEAFKDFLANFDIIQEIENFEVKLLDFGLSETIDENGYCNNDRSGTLKLMSPE